MLANCFLLLKVGASNDCCATFVGCFDDAVTLNDGRVDSPEALFGSGAKCNQMCQQTKLKESSANHAVQVKCCFSMEPGNLYHLSERFLQKLCRPAAKPNVKLIFLLSRVVANSVRARNGGDTWFVACWSTQSE